MFWFEKKIIAIIPFFVCIIAQGQTDSLGRECKRTAEVGVSVDKFQGVINIDPHVIYKCDSCHYLRATDSTYTIIEFKMKTELTNGDIKERFVYGRFLLSNAYAEGDLVFSKEGTYIYFYCIKAMKEGKVFYLTPFSIRYK